jgi:hypothetical protein
MEHRDGVALVGFDEGGYICMWKNFFQKCVVSERSYFGCLAFILVVRKNS